MLRKLKNKINVWRIKRHKKSFYLWRLRYDTAVDRVWNKFLDMPISEASIVIFKKNNNRLLRVNINRLNNHK